MRRRRNRKNRIYGVFAVMAENGFKETDIGVIPEDWNVVNLSDNSVADLIMGQSPSSSTYNQDGVGLPFMQGKAEFGRIYPNPDKWCSSPSRVAEQNDVLMSVRAPVGDVNMAPFKCAIGRGLAAIRAKQKSKSLYLFFYLHFAKKRLEDEGTGSTFKEINKGVLENFKLALPEIDEQKNIIAVLSKLQQTIAHQEKIIAKTKELKRSLMHRLFTYGLRGEELKETEIGLMPESWDAKPFESLCENVKDSWNPGQYLNGIYVGLEHIESGNSVLKSFGTAQNLRSSKFIFSEGDILYGKLRPYLDKAVITNKKGICSTDILVFRPKNNVPAGFIVNLIHWSPFIEYAKKTTHGVNHPRTSWNSIRNFTCGIPQYEEQKEIASILSSIDEKIERERQREYQFKALFKSILQLLMTGQVRVKDIDFGDYL